MVDRWATYKRERERKKSKETEESHGITRTWWAFDIYLQQKSKKSCIFQIFGILYIPESKAPAMTICLLVLNLDHYLQYYKTQQRHVYGHREESISDAGNLLRSFQQHSLNTLCDLYLPAAPCNQCHQSLPSIIHNIITLIKISQDSAWRLS